VLVSRSGFGTQNSSARAPQIVFDLNVPILGICYGMQTMATQLGGQATSADKHEYGFAKVRARYIIKMIPLYKYELSRIHFSFI
jgi:GMP synthase-like glutamine amidotransferase